MVEYGPWYVGCDGGWLSIGQSELILRWCQVEWDGEAGDMLSAGVLTDN